MSFPNPLSWAADQVSGFLGGVASSAFNTLIEGLMGWVMDAVMWVVGGIFNFFLDAQDPNVQADWFAASGGPYATTAGIGAVLMVGFLFAGITQGALAGDVGGMLRRVALDLPVSVLGIVGLVTFTQALVRLTDELSTHVMRHFESDVSDFTTVMVSVSRLAGVSNFVVLLLGIVTVLAGIVLVAELAVRAALVYIVVALAPLVFAARLWPALQGMCRKLLEILVALVLSKLVIAIALSVAAAAAVGTGSGGEVTALPEPEVIAEDPDGSVTQAVGVLLAAAAAFGVAAFSPLLVTKLLPLTEAAVVGQGVRGGPLRAGQQAMSTAYSMDIMSNGRLRRLASSGAPSGGGAGARGAAASGGGAGSGGAAGLGGPAAAAVVAAKAVKGAARQGAQAAAGVAGGSGASGGGGAKASGGGSRPATEVENRDDPVRPSGRRVPNTDVPLPPRAGSRPAPAPAPSSPASKRPGGSPGAG
jgi:hypothetical protein